MPYSSPTPGSWMWTHCVLVTMQGGITSKLTSEDFRSPCLGAQSKCVGIKTGSFHHNAKFWKAGAGAGFSCFSFPCADKLRAYKQEVFSKDVQPINAESPVGLNKSFYMDQLIFSL